jgi:tRNA(Arg) A34 adenosine deaminase TadA
VAEVERSQIVRELRQERVDPLMSSYQAPASRRKLLQLGSLLLSTLPFRGVEGATAANDDEVSQLDRERMRALAAWTALALDGPNPGPYASEIFDSKSGVSIIRTLNLVRPEHDPSAHAEVSVVRLATKKLQRGSLLGYTLYTTCEPCPMCMACCLWARVDRVVFGATVSDAAKYGHQIMIPAAEIVRRSDMVCIVNGPVERERCLELFTDARVQKVFKTWKW